MQQFHYVHNFPSTRFVVFYIKEEKSIQVESFGESTFVNTDMARQEGNDLGTARDTEIAVREPPSVRERPRPSILDTKKRTPTEGWMRN